MGDKVGSLRSHLVMSVINLMNINKPLHVSTSSGGTVVNDYQLYCCNLLPQTNSVALREASLMAYCRKAINLDPEVLELTSACDIFELRMLTIIERDVESIFNTLRNTVSSRP